MQRVNAQTHSDSRPHSFPVDYPSTVRFIVSLCTRSVHIRARSAARHSTSRYGTALDGTAYPCSSTSLPPLPLRCYQQSVLCCVVQRRLLAKVHSLRINPLPCTIKQPPAKPYTCRQHTRQYSRHLNHPTPTPVNAPSNSTARLAHAPSPTHGSRFRQSTQILQ